MKKMPVKKTVREMKTRANHGQFEVLYVHWRVRDAPIVATQTAFSGFPALLAEVKEEVYRSFEQTSR